MAVTIDQGRADDGRAHALAPVGKDFLVECDAGCARRRWREGCGLVEDVVYAVARGARANDARAARVDENFARAIERAEQSHGCIAVIGTSRVDDGISGARLGSKDCGIVECAGDRRDAKRADLLGPFSRAHEPAHLMAVRDKCGRDRASDIAGCSRAEDFHERSSMKRRR